jgi:HK97 family phage major capsid protein
VHDDSRLPIGVVEGLRLDGRKLRGLARFGNSVRAREVFADVVDHIVNAVSVGYRYLDEGVREGPRGLRFRWQPLEASAVPIAADPNAGFNRKGNTMHQRSDDSNDDARQNRAERALAQRQKIDEQFAALPGDDIEAFRQHVRELEGEYELGELAVLRSLGPIKQAYETWRHTAIRNLASMWQDQGNATEINKRAAAAALNPQMTVDTFRKEILRMISTNSQIDTGQLEADRLAYGAAARVSERHSPLTHIQGKDAEARAYQAGMFFRHLVGDGRATSWCRDKGLLQERALGTGVFSAGGALVPEPMANEILVLQESFGVFRQFARQWPMDSGSLSIPVKTAGLNVTSLGEGAVTPTSDPAFSNVMLVAKEFGGGARVHRNLIEDSPIALGDFIIGEFAHSLAEAEDGCGFIGTGISSYGGMQGINFLLEDGSHAGGVVAASSGHDTFPEIDVSDLVSLMGRCPEYARAGAAWYLSSTARDTIFMRLMMGSGGNTLDAMRSGVGESFMGYPVRVSQKFPAGASTVYNNEVICLFGNLSLSSAFGARRGVQVDIDSSRFVEYREIYFQATERFDVVNHHVGTATEAGPIVGLVGTT